MTKKQAMNTLRLNALVLFILAVLGGTFATLWFHWWVGIVMFVLGMTAVWHQFEIWYELAKK